jgi:sigma-B regulation protein RsbU (phosphoserine phosphatase)
LIFSDGIVECPSPKGELLQEEGLEEIMRELSDTSGAALLEALIWKLSAFADDGNFPDDVSAILVEFHGPPV